MLLEKNNLKRLIDHLKPFDDRNGNFIIECPECSHRECSISYKKENHQWGCFRKKKCGATGNIHSLLAKIGKTVNVEREVDVFEEKISHNVIKAFEDEIKNVYLEDAKMPIGYKRINDSEYLNGRGFTKQDYLLWEVGISNIFLKDYVIFPIYQNGSVKGYVGRYCGNNDTKPKYKNSKSDFVKILGGLDTIQPDTHTIFLCEGYFDIINISRQLSLFNDDEFRALCTFGAKVSKEQIDLMVSHGIETVFLLYDNDVPKVVKQASMTLSKYFDVKVLTLVGDIDAGDCNINEIEEAIMSAKSPLEFNMMSTLGKIVEQ